MRRKTGIAVPLMVAVVAAIGSLTGVSGQSSPTLRKWAKPLPQLPGGVLAPDGVADDGVHGVAPLYKIVMRQFRQQFHPDLPATTVYGYNSHTPGPVIVARTNEPLYVRYYNRLPTTPLFPPNPLVAPTIFPDVRTITHLHGGHVPSDSDGIPTAWFVPGRNRLHWYPNTQPAAGIWFHDHALGVTRTNVYAGLAGAYLIRDDREDALNLPQAPYEAALIIQDKTFNADGSLFYPESFERWFFGDTIVVNGRVWPYMNVEPRRYRFRVLNGSNSRFYALSLGATGPTLQQIGGDCGFLPRTAIKRRLLLAPAERADVIIDFSGFAGQSLVMTNNARETYPTGTPPDEDTSRIVKFNVNLPLSGPDTSAVPAEPLPDSLRPPLPTVINKVRWFTLDKDSGDRFLINNLAFDDPVTEIIKEGDTEIWRFLNLHSDTHPMHIHLAQFRVLHRRSVDVSQYLATGQVVWTSPAVAPDPNERGDKDTVRVDPHDVVSVQMTFDKTPDHTYTGEYVYHCHILEHEEYDMMRPMVVVPTP